MWSQMIASLGNIRSIFAENKDIENGLKEFTLKLVSATTDRIGWEIETNEDYLTGQLRALIISAAGGAGHGALVFTLDSVIVSAK